MKGSGPYDIVKVMVKETCTGLIEINDFLTCTQSQTGMSHKL